MSLILIIIVRLEMVRRMAPPAPPANSCRSVHQRVPQQQLHHAPDVGSAVSPCSERVGGWVRRGRSSLDEPPQRQNHQRHRSGRDKAPASLTDQHTVAGHGTCLPLFLRGLPFTVRPACYSSIPIVTSPRTGNGQAK